MKKQNQGYLTYVTKMELLQLTSIVEERIALDVKPEEKKIFTSADLWNIQRNRRSFTQRRSIL
ncbi:MAG: hypothetical protein V4685_10570 [Bacteroidota bacterium]